MDKETQHAKLYELSSCAQCGGTRGAGRDYALLAIRMAEPVPGAGNREGNDPRDNDPGDEVPFGSDGALFLCNLLQHGVFLGGVMLLLMLIGYFGTR